MRATSLQRLHAEAAALMLGPCLLCARGGHGGHSFKAVAGGLNPIKRAILAAGLGQRGAWEQGWHARGVGEALVQVAAEECLARMRRGGGVREIAACRRRCAEHALALVTAQATKAVCVWHTHVHVCVTTTHQLTVPPARARTHTHTHTHTHHVLLNCQADTRY